MSFRVRAALETDARGVLDIYSNAITDSAASFETRVPSTEEMADRIRTAMQALPWHKLGSWHDVGWWGKVIQAHPVVLHLHSMS